MTSSASSVRDALEGYVAGQIPVERVVAVVAAGYYRDAGSGMRDALKPVMEIVERAHPGIVELSGTADRPGFALKLAERPFPKRYEGEFRQAVQALLVGGVPETHPASRIAHPATRPSIWERMVRAVRRVFTA